MRDETLMERTFANVASWALFLVAMAVAVIWSLFLLSAAATFGFGQVIAAGPWAIAVVTYLLSMPLIFGSIGLLKSSAARRFIASAGIALTVLAYLYVGTRV